MCKKQTAVSHSSTESEIISLDEGLRLDCIPAFDIWKPVNPQDCVRENLYRVIMRSILQEKETINSPQHFNLVHKFIPMPQAMKIPAAKAAVDKEWRKMENISAPDESQK